MWFRKKKRVLFGAVDIGYRIEHYSKFIRTHFNDELEAESFSKYVLPEAHFKTKYTYSCPIDRTHPIKFYFYTFTFFIRALFRYQVFHFISGETLLTWKLRRLELSIYRLLGKKIIMHFVGSDIRNEEYLKEKDEHLAAYLRGEYTMQTPISSEIQLKLIKDCRQYCDHIIVSTPDLLNIIPEAHFIPVFLDVETIHTTKNKLSDKLTILHSPSHSTNKGSKHIHEILIEIGKEFSDFVEVKIPALKSQNKLHYTLTRYHLLDELSKADIVIDQMLIGWYGLKTVESLFLDCEVFCFIEKDCFKYLPQSRKLHPVTILNLKEELITTIEKMNISKQRNDFLRELPAEHEINNYGELFAYFWLEKHLENKE